MEELKGPLATMLGNYYPTGYVVGVIHDREEADRAARSLQESGFGGEQVRVFTSDFVIEQNRAYLQQRGPGERLGSLIPSDESSAQHEYLEEAGRGAHFVTVHATHLEQVERARGVLASHGAHRLRHYGEYEITDLV